MAGPWEKYGAAVQDGPWAKYAQPAEGAPPEAKPQRSFLQDVQDTVSSALGFAGDLNRNFRQQAGNAAAGSVRGAGSIGATAVRPFESAQENEQRRQAMTDTLAGLGADPESLVFQGAKLGTEIAGTSGIGGTLAKGAQAVGAAPSVVNALSTAGFRAGQAAPGFGGAAANTLTRIGAGAAVGGAAAGMIDPENAAAGAAIGGALPVALPLLGKTANALGRVVSGPEVAPSVRQGVQAARESGYVIPPSQAKPTLVNRALEGFSGKITTAQNASARNQAVTNRLVAQELGLPAETQLSPEILDGVRRTAGQAYEAVGATGIIRPGPEYARALDGITATARKAAEGFPDDAASPLIKAVDALRSNQFDAASAIAKIKGLRAQADKAYAGGDKELGRALKSASGALEDAIEAHLQRINAPDGLLDGFRNARQLIAKTYTVQSALNGTSGTVNAQKLAGQLSKGKPLSGNILAAAKFAEQFPKAAQPLERMGSLPQVSPLDFGALGTISAATSNPALMAGVLARPAARSAVLSPMVQNRLATAPGTNSLASLIADPAAAQLVYRAAPSGLANR